MNNKKLLNNKGFSLVELMIVIAISAVLVGLVTITMSIVNNANSAKAAEAMAAALTNCRTLSMAKGDDKGQFNYRFSAGKLAYSTGESLNNGAITNNRNMKVYFGVHVNGALQGWNTGALGQINGAAGSITFNTAGMVKTINGAPANLGVIYVFAFKYGNNKRVDAVLLYPATGKTDTIMWYE